MNLFENEHKKSPKDLGTIFFPCLSGGFEDQCMHLIRISIQKRYIQFDIDITGDEKLTRIVLDLHH